MGWQPISTAPKDGTIVLCARFGNSKKVWHMRVCRWGHILARKDLGFTKEGWHVYTGQNAGWFQPTHWMPLPAPPLASNAEGE